MSLENIAKYNLSVIHSAISEPEVKQVWHVISPFVNEKAPRISATHEDINIAIKEVVDQIT